MVQVNLKELIAKLNDTCRRALEGAAGLCLSRSNYNVEVEHWLIKLLESTQCDLPLILRYFEVDASRLGADLTRVVDRFKTGNARPPALSQNVVDLVREAWLVCSVDYGERAIRSGHLLQAILGSDALGRAVLGGIKSLEGISYESLRKDLVEITAKSEEAAAAVSDAAPTSGAPGEPVRVGGPSKTPALDQYTNDLTQQARSGKLDPVLGRDTEIRQIVDILTRRRQNNPILTGEAGVGKTAVVEGFALRIVAGDVPPALKDVSIRSLDLGLLQAGAGVKGEFENRLKSVINEVKSSPKPIIMFIDEAHTMIGAGGQAGQGDAANLLKPALARGELRTIAATTWAEYKKYFEKDAALARRFQVVMVDEPTEASCVDMMRGLVGTLERHHGVRILNEAIVDAVRLSKRYITGRQLPDKAVSVLDTTCARIAISQSATPPEIEDCQRRITQLGVALDILQRESEAGVDHQEQITELTQLRSDAEKRLEECRQRWQVEKDLVTKILEMNARLSAKPAAAGAPPPAGAAPAPAVPAAKGAGPAPAAAPGAKPPAAPPPPPLTPEERQAMRGQLEVAEAELKKLQGETPLVHVYVDAQAVAGTIAGWTGIPLRRMVADQLRTIQRLKELMEESIVGQSHALEAIARRIRTSRANLADPRQPIGVFLLAGTSGTGKTETAITLANLLYGGEQNMTVLNMSEFKEEHKVSLLMGSPPGYVGYGEGGVLTEAVRRKPYSVVLLDEMEKAHPGVQDIFYQVFDKGMLKDGEGRDINFKNTVIIMTTNAGTDLIKGLCSDPDTRPDPDKLSESLFPELLKTFKPAFLGRLAVVPFYTLTDEVMRRIIELKLGKIARRVHENYKATFRYTQALVDAVLARCTEVDTGARNVDHILNGTLLPELSSEFLARMADGLPITSVEVSVRPEGGFSYTIL